MTTPNLSLTSIKLGDSATPSKNFIISVPDIPDGTLTIERGDGTDVLTIDAAGKVAFPTGIVSDQGLPVFQCRAWCFFNGVTAGANPPSAGGNVSTISRNGVGDYNVYFTARMPNAQYSVTALSSTINGVFSGLETYPGYFRVRHYLANTGASVDCGLSSISVTK